MGRNSGGVNNHSEATKKTSVRKGITEDGYTRKMMKNIVGLEQRFRNNRDETLHFFTPKGDLIESVGGKGAEVKYSSKKQHENSIITHNHPRSLGKTGIQSIGNSFSIQDVASMVHENASEMRAVTPRYTFSVKRPKGGWGASRKEAIDAYRISEYRVKDKLQSYIDNYKGDFNKAIERANAMHFDLVMRDLSKKFGWKYSHKRG